MKIAEIVKRKQEIIELKKAAIKHSDPLIFNNSGEKPNISIVKSSTNKGDEGALDVTLIANTYNWMDSHGDVHLDGVFSKTIRENGEKVLHLHDHIHQLAAKVGRNKKVYEQPVKWRDLGVQKDGYTTALFMDSEVLRTYNAMIFDQYKGGEINQHSVGMIYVKIDLAVNDPEFKEEYSLWNKVFPLIGNPEAAENAQHFWVVTEAKLKEISCVIEGSNELTPTVDTKDNEPSEDTQESKDEEAETRTITSGVKKKAMSIYQFN